MQLEFAQQVEDMNAPGWALHPLKGEYRGFWSVRVSGNWRIVFRFDDGHAWDVDYIDYH
jgi:proteic killer suppression protein